jgi:hypothetical protein
MGKARKNRASKQEYVSERQLSLVVFETPFTKTLRAGNRWVELANKISWNALVGAYMANMHNERTGADGINPRVAIGSIIIKHISNLSDRETV